MMHRRQLLKLGMFGATAAAWPCSAWLVGLPGMPELCAWLDDPALAIRIGRAYRAAHPEEDSAFVLAAALASTAATPEREFARGDYLCLCGWIVARSEAREAALWSLSRS